MHGPLARPQETQFYSRFPLLPHSTLQMLDIGTLLASEAPEEMLWLY